MPIYYCLVAKKGGIILTEFTSYQGNFNRYANDLITRIQDNSMKTFELEDFLFHYVNEHGVYNVARSADLHASIEQVHLISSVRYRPQVHA